MQSFDAGESAANGAIASLHAKQGFEASDEIIEGKRGFCRIYPERFGREARPLKPAAW